MASKGITGATVNGKRPSTEPAVPLRKKVKTSEAPSANEEHGIVLRQFYPPEMDNSRCNMYKNGGIEKPIQTLSKALAGTKSRREKVQPKDAVLHWFKTDLRTLDNHGLHSASQKAKEKGVPLICLYILSPQDFQAHLMSAIRVDFILRTLHVLQKDLAEFAIPLYMFSVDKRKEIPEKLIGFCKEWGVSHVYTNIEYEVDELRREALLTRKCLDAEISFDAVPDTCVVEPGKLSSQTGNQFSVYSPWYRTWVRYLHERPATIEPFARPERNPESARKKLSALFDCKVPAAPANKKLSEEEQQRFKSMWPPGEHEANERLQKFIKNKIGQYKDRRNIPADNGTAVISVHLAAGTLSARAAVRAARDANTVKKLDGGNIGHSTWISEAAWRDFYKHVLVWWPYVCMNKSFKPEYTRIRWEYDAEKFDAWCEGRTGFPIVDAAMRQLNYTGYMHNRCRMIVASFLAKDLLIDWRMGERYFMEHLVDGDFASNNGGWGFSASTGVDPSPFFRVFNPFLQSEKFDPDGKYIRKWVPELGTISGKAIHDPFGRGAENSATKNGYPRPMVNHSESRARALARYKEGIGRETA